MIKRNTRGQFIKGSQFWLGKKRPDISETMRLAIIGRFTGNKNVNWKGGPRKKHCIYCGKEYFVKPYAIHRSKFCSRSCKSGYLFKGSKNKNWKGEITKDRDKLKATENYKRWRLKVFRRDYFTCRLCGFRSKASKAHGNKESDIQAHHIETVEENPRLCLKVGNGITLCKKCHRLTYGKEELFAKVFKEILNDFTSNIPKG